MILGLRLAGGPFDSELAEIRAQPRERPLVQEAGEIIRSVGQQFAAPETDEEIEIFALDALDIGALRRLRECGMRQSERARIAAQRGEARKQRGIRRARQQHRQQRVFLRARGIDLVDIAGRAGVLSVKIGPQNRPAHAGRRLDREHALGGNARPVRNRRLRYADFTGKRADPAGDADRFVQAYIPHRRFFFYY